MRAVTSPIGQALDAGWGRTGRSPWAYVVPAFLALAIGGLAGVEPRLALGAAVGALLAGLILVNLPIGVSVFVVVAHLEALPRLGGAVSLAKLTGLLLLTSWVLAAILRPQPTRTLLSLTTLQTAVLAWFLFWLAATLIWADDVGAGMETLPRYALNLTLFPIVAGAIQERRHVTWFVTAMVAGAWISATYGLVFRPVEEGRISGAGLNANALGMVLIFGIVLATSLTFNRRLSSPQRWLAGATAVFCLYALLSTVSRGALVGCAAGLIAALFFAPPGKRATMAILGLLAIASVVLYFGAFAPAAARERVTEAGDGSGRVDIWAVGWRMVEANPVKGVGVGNFRTSSVDYVLLPGSVPRSELLVDEQKVPHNLYLQFLAETGVIGTLLFAAVVGFVLYSALTAAKIFTRRGEHDMSLIARGMAIALVGVLAASIFSSQVVFLKTLWLAMALCPALLALARRSPPPAPSGAVVRRT